MISTLHKYEEKSIELLKDGGSQADRQSHTFDIMNLAAVTETSTIRTSIMRLKNPYTHLFYWVKGEMTDCLALQQAIGARLGQNITILTKLKSKALSALDELQKVQGGKTSFKTMFKSSKEKEQFSEKLKKNIVEAENSFEDWLKINACVDIHLAELIIPRFKQDKLENFGSILKQFSNHEIRNNNVAAEFWSKVHTRTQQHPQAHSATGVTTSDRLIK